MTVVVGFHPEADAELVADVGWYELRERGLGRRFLGAVRSAVDAAVDDPAAWPIWPGWDRVPTVRSKGVGDFPYRIVYVVLTIIAVAASRRRPGYWRDRVDR